MAVRRWTLTDGDQTVEVEMNPDAGGTPQFGRTLNYQAPAAPDGQLILSEGKPQADTMTFSGSVLYQSHFEMLDTWFRKRCKITIVDDLGRSFNVFFTGWQPQRVRSAIHPWRHTYTATAVITV